MPIAYDYINNFRQDLQDGQDLNVVLWHPVNPVHPVHYVCAPCIRLRGGGQVLRFKQRLDRTSIFETRLLNDSLMVMFVALIK
jgi:hypothetical protein